MFACTLFNSVPDISKFVQCVARKVPELCKAYTPGKSDQDMGARIARLEHIIEMALPQYCMPATPGSTSYDSHNAAEQNRNNSEDDNADDADPSGGSFQSGRWYGNSASGSIAPGSIIEQASYFPLSFISSHRYH